MPDPTIEFVIPEKPNPELPPEQKPEGEGDEQKRTPAPESQDGSFFISDEVASQYDIIRAGSREDNARKWLAEQVKLNPSIRQPIPKELQGAVAAAGKPEEKKPEAEDEGLPFAEKNSTAGLPEFKSIEALAKYFEDKHQVKGGAKEIIAAFEKQRNSAKELGDEAAKLRQFPNFINKLPEKVKDILRAIQNNEDYEKFFQPSGMDYTKKFDDQKADEIFKTFHPDVNVSDAADDDYIDPNDTKDSQRNTLYKAARKLYEAEGLRLQSESASRKRTEEESLTTQMVRAKASLNHLASMLPKSSRDKSVKEISEILTSSRDLDGVFYDEQDNLREDAATQLYMARNYSNVLSAYQTKISDLEKTITDMKAQSEESLSSGGDGVKTRAHRHLKENVQQEQNTLAEFSKKKLSFDDLPAEKA